MNNQPGNSIAMIGAHTDSPCLRVKPVSKKHSEGFLQVGVETYGGGLWHTWFDRDLSIAGRAMIRTSEDQITQKLVKIDRPSRAFAEFLPFRKNLCNHSSSDTNSCHTPRPSRDLFVQQRNPALPNSRPYISGTGSESPSAGTRFSPKPRKFEPIQGAYGEASSLFGRAYSQGSRSGSNQNRRLRDGAL